MACCACHPPTLQLGRPVGHPGGAWTLPRGLHTVSRIAALPEDASAGSCPHRKAALERIPTLAGLPVEREVPSTWRRSLALVARRPQGQLSCTPGSQQRAAGSTATLQCRQGGAAAF